ncbi:MAG: clostripain-related cysteine peptidase [Chloroflexi bacterium]|nr:clostripain-related cysteine peptidase [Chloroflexota bacterium]
MDIRDVSQKSLIVQQGLAAQSQPLKKAEKEEQAADIKDKVSISRAGKKGSSKSAPAVKDTGEQTPLPKKKWTVLFYMDGNNNLQGLATATFRQLERVGSNENMNVVAELSRPKKEYDILSADWSGTKRYYVEKNPKPLDPNQEMLHWMIPPFTQNIYSRPVQDLGDVDMGSHKTLDDFLKWGIKNYPAENYMVVMMDHGAGYLGSMQDEKTGNIITNERLKEVLDNAAKTAGKEVDIVAFDACLMGQAEVGQTLKDSAGIMIGSEENEAGAATPYAPILKDLKEGTEGDKNLDPRDLAKLYVYETAVQQGAEVYTPTQSAVDLKKMPALGKATDELAKALINTKTDIKHIRETIKKTQHYCNAVDYKPYIDYRDMGDFVTKLKNNPEVKDPEIKKACDNVMAALKEAVIVEQHVGSKVKDSHGLSVYLPDNYGHDRAPVAFPPPTYSKTHRYEKTAMSHETNWDEMLTKFSKDTKFNEFLKKLGVSENTLDRLHQAKIIVSKPITIGGSLANNVGSYEAFYAMSHDQPRNLLFLGGMVAAKIGVAGGAYSAFKGASHIFKSASDADSAKLEKTKNVMDGSMDFTTGVAVTAACLGLAGAMSAGVTTAAGVASVAIPIAKTVFDIYMQQKISKVAQKEYDALKKTLPKDIQGKLEAIENGNIPRVHYQTTRTKISAKVGPMRPLEFPDKYKTT